MKNGIDFKLTSFKISIFVDINIPITKDPSMKKTLLFTFLSIGFIFPVLAQNNKHALIIALSEYNRETGWRNINSANDVQLIKNALIAKGFAEENIIVHSDGLTKDGILDAIQKDLIDKVQPGDMAYFQYSGHGQQVADDNNDEVDGLDEALVPVDAPVGNRYKDPKTGQVVNYDGSKHLRDDDLGAILDKLRTKLGTTGNVMVVIDACHSGSATRGIGLARGTSEPNVPDGWKAPASASSRGAVETETGFGLITVEQNKAGMVCFFGSSQDELNYEYEDNDGKRYGSLSYALSKALTESKSTTSYRALFENIKNTMGVIAPKQVPQVEGVIDQEILGGKLLDAPSYYNVIDWKATNKVEINVGKLQSINNGSIVSFYPPDTRISVDSKKAPAKPIATGKVVSAGWTSSEVELTSGALTKEDAEKSWCYITEKSVVEKPLTVQISASSKDVKVVRKIMAEYPTLVITDKPNSDLLLEVGTGASTRGASLVTITTKTDNVIYEKAMADAKGVQEDEVKAAVKSMANYAQANLIKGIEIENPSMQGEVIIVPIKIREGADMKNLKDGDTEELDPATLKDANGIVRVPIGTYIRFKVRNNSSSKLYYALIDIDPNNNITAVYPDAKHTPSEFKLEGFGVSDKTNFFRAGAPEGGEVLKLIMSDKPLNLREIIGTRGVTEGSSPIEALIQRSYNSTRGPEEVPITTENIGVYTFTYQVEKAK